MFSSLFRAPEPAAASSRPAPRPKSRGEAVKDKKAGTQKPATGKRKAGKQQDLDDVPKKGRSEGKSAQKKPSLQAARSWQEGPVTSQKGKQKKKKKQRGPAAEATQRSGPGITEEEPPLATPKGSSAVHKAAARLKGSRFRWLNETLYTITGDEAKSLFQKDPSLAQAYHEGFRAQAMKWPRNPLDDVIKWLKEDVSPKAIIGDFGCGEARLALELKGRKVHSFDLVEVNERVTACNLAAVPLPDSSIDVAVFCLALMGTDWPAFLEEAHRCLKPKGLCHIVEVESRFKNIGAVVKRIEGIGFTKVHLTPGSFFVEMRFMKSSGGTARLKGKAKVGADLLTSCTYRKR